MGSVMKANLGFFMETPSDNIIYTLTYDQAIIDDRLSTTIQAVLISAAWIVGGFLIMNYVYYLVFTVLTIAFWILMARIFRRYTEITQPLLEALNEKKISQLKIYINTLDTILALRGIGKSRLQEAELLQVNDDVFNLNSHIAGYAEKWMGVRIAFLNCFLTVLSLMMPLVTLYLLPPFFGDDSAWKIAIALTWSYRIAIYATSLLGQITWLSNDMNSVRNLESYFEIDDEGSMKSRPQQKYHRFVLDQTGSAVSVKNLRLSIHGNKIFSGVDFKVAHGERVALIGSSGSGKHSLFKVLLDLY